ncbi:hypothetical protein H0H87_006353 [Tephrocybe sp. NHM501043]|nr:hypothetical protein H0H87_006353 [Tephrocybe sp. NHM501043]
MKHRRYEAFRVLTERFVDNSLGMWIDCGHIEPVPMSNTPPTSFYGMTAHTFKNHAACRYPESSDPYGEWGPTRANVPFVSVACCQTKEPNSLEEAACDEGYDVHPKVEKWNGSDFSLD